jgi:hypothetical protein
VIMPTRLVHLAVDSAEISLLGRFWAEVLGWPILLEEPDEVYIEPEGGGVGIAFVPVPEPKTVKNRVHFDLTSSSAQHHEELITKALDLGARRADIGQGDVSWVVLADPEGNEFCVTKPSPAYGSTGVLAAITQDCSNPAALAPFWSAASGWPILRWNDDVAALRPLQGSGPWLSLVRSDDPKQVKNRVHLDTAPFAGDDHAAEVNRLLALGARRVDVGQGDVSWEVLADPQGNEFCVLSPRD